MLLTENHAYAAAQRRHATLLLKGISMGDHPFTTSVIGSLPRPRFVKDLIADDSPISDTEYQRLMGEAIRAAVALQETAGLYVVTDGEWWRKSYIGVIAELAHGFELSRNPADG